MTLKNNVYTFETERLFIRPINQDDAEFILELLNTPKWKQFIGDRKVHTVEQAKEYIVIRMLPQLKKLGHTNNVIIRKDDQKKIGTIGIYSRENIVGLDLGFAFLPAYEKQGYAFEAASLLKKEAYKSFNIKELFAYTLPSNSNSQKLLKKLGFEFLRNAYLENDGDELLQYYTTLP